MSRILLVDADSRIPNLALMKLSAWHKSKGDEVALVKLKIPFIIKHRRIYNINTSMFDRVYCSTIFNENWKFVKGDGIIFGGTGYNLTDKLPDEIENSAVDYSIYGGGDTSYGFITRGCVRKCPWCKVSEKEGKIRQVASIDDIVRHRKVHFMDNNFLAWDGHSDVLKQLIKRKDFKFSFNQGLDIRLLDKENAELLKQCNYWGPFIFALDDVKMIDIAEKKIGLIHEKGKHDCMFYVYVHPRMEISDTIRRVVWLRKNDCLPYIMRDVLCHDRGWKYYHFMNSLFCYCNFGGYFFGCKFDDFQEGITDDDRRIWRANQ